MRVLAAEVRGKSTLRLLSEVRSFLGHEPRVSLDDGVKRFVAWYKEYYHS